MATRTLKKAPKEAAAKARKKRAPKRRRSPFEGKDIVLIKPAERMYVEPGTGEVFKLWVDPSGMASGWSSTGEYVLLDGAGSQPPGVGTVPPDIAERARTSPLDSDAILAVSAASFCNTNAQYNADRYAAFVDAMINWQKMKQGKKPIPPAPPETDPSKWVRGVQYYRPCNFAFVYDWMRRNKSGSNPADVHIPLPPEVDYNQG
jgi:hypothetical protein